MRNLVILLLSVFIPSLCFADATGYSLKSAKVRKDGANKICAKFGSSWAPAYKSDGLYYKAKQLKKDAKEDGNKSLVKRLTRIISSSSALCASLNSLRSSLNDLSKLPDPSEAISTDDSESESLGLMSVSGTPPTISELTEMTASELEDQFFANDEITTLVNASAPLSPGSPACSNFFVGEDQGSAGLIGMQAIAESARSMGEGLGAGATTCYMKSMSNVELYGEGADQGLTVTDGSLTEAQIRNLLKPKPENFDFKVSVANFPGGEDEEGGGPAAVVIRVHKKNNSTGETKWSLAFCDGDGQSNGGEVIKMLPNGKFTSVSKQKFGAGGFQFNVQAWIASGDDGLEFDVSKNKIFSLKYNDGDRAQIAKVTIDGDKVTTLTKEEQGSSARYSKLVANGSGDNIADFKVLEAAIKFKEEENGSQIFSEALATEYRDTMYVRADDSALLDEVEDENFNGSLFNDEVDPDVDTTLGCDGPFEAEIEMDFSSSALLAVASQCEQGHQLRIEFPFGVSEIQQAQENYSNYCQ